MKALASDFDGTLICIWMENSHYLVNSVAETLDFVL